MSLLYILDLIGTAAFAASGAWAGIRARMDMLGVLVLGVVTATGGGTLRDILLGDFPPFCLKDELYLYVSLAVALLVFFFNRHMTFFKNPLLYFDAVGLGTFVVIGTQKAMTYQMGALGAILLGVMTATAGGVIRDVLSNEVPLIMRKETLYASVCIAGAILLVLLSHTPLAGAPATLLAASTVIVLRILAIRYSWTLPRADELEH